MNGSKIYRGQHFYFSEFVLILVLHFQNSFSYIFYFLYIRQSLRRNIFITFIHGGVSFLKITFLNFKEFYIFTDFILFLNKFMVWQFYVKNPCL